MAGIALSATRLGKKKNIKREWLGIVSCLYSSTPLSDVEIKKNTLSTIHYLFKSHRNPYKYNFSEEFKLITVTSPLSGWSLAQKLALAFGFGLVVAECKKQVKTDFRFFNTVRYGSSVELKKVLKDDSINVNLKHYLGWTALHLAAVNGNSENLKILIEAGGDINAGDDYINNYRTAHEKGLNTFEDV